MASEIKNSEEKIANSSSMTQKEAEKEKKRLSELKSTQASLSTQMINNVKTFSKWYQTLEGGGEEAESYRETILALIEESELRQRVGQKLKLCPEQYLPIVEGAIDGALKIEKPNEETEGV